MAERVVQEIIERLPGEQNKAYDARIKYVLMGPTRSIERVRIETGKTAASRRLLEHWSSQYKWRESARIWDDKQAELMVIEAGTQYQRSLAEYDDRYGRTARELHSVALKLLKRLEREIDTIELTPGTLAVMTKMIELAADIEARGLQVERVVNLLEAQQHVITIDQQSNTLTPTTTHQITTD